MKREVEKKTKFCLVDKNSEIVKKKKEFQTEKYQ